MPLCLQSVGNKNGKLWTTDEEVSPEVLAKVRGKHTRDICLTCTPTLFFIYTSCTHIYNQKFSCLCDNTRNCQGRGTSLCLIIHAFPLPSGAGHQATRALATRNEEQPIQVSKLHPAAAVSHAGQRGRPHRAEEDQVTLGFKVTVLGKSRAVGGLGPIGGMHKRKAYFRWRL